MVITGGAPIGISGTTNIMKVHLVGDILVTGTGVTPQKRTAELYVLQTAAEVRDHLKAGGIAVIPEATAEMVPYLKRQAVSSVKKRGKPAMRQLLV